MLLHPEQRAEYPVVNDRQLCMLLKSRLRSMLRHRILGWLKMKNCTLVSTGPVSRSCAISYLAEPVLRDPPAAPPAAPPEELPDEPEDDPLRPPPPPPPPDPPPPLLFSRWFRSSSSKRSLSGPDSTRASGSDSRREMASLEYRVDRIEREETSDVVASKSTADAVTFMLVVRYPNRCSG